MIKIILPENNMDFLNHLNDDVLKDVCNIIFNTKSFTKEYENRRFGRYIKIINEETKETHYVCFSNPDNDGRNSRLMQFISPTYIDYFNDTSDNKFIDIYIINPDRNDKTDYIKLFYRCFITIGINILNINKLDFSGITSFVNYEDLKRYRNNNSERNVHNNQTYFTDDDKQISFYGKTFGANAMESFILALSISKITSKKIVFYPVVDNDSKSISNDQKNILMSFGINFGDTINEINNNNIDISQSEEILRDTPKFHYNLLKKYGDKRCYLCGCDLEHLIIGSHIERVADIKKEKTYSDNEKKQRIVDQDNGFWLCANHDKMFEFGTIYFEGPELKIISNLKTIDFDFINYSIFNFRKIYFPLEIISGKSFKIKDEDYNINMEQYILKHFNRIRLV